MLNQCFKDIKSSYLLRMQSDSFLMIIDKESNTYFNLYENENFTKQDLKRLANILDKHEKIKECYEC